MHLQPWKGAAGRSNQLSILVSFSANILPLIDILLSCQTNQIKAAGADSTHHHHHRRSTVNIHYTCTTTSSLHWPWKETRPSALFFPCRFSATHSYAPASSCWKLGISRTALEFFIFTLLAKGTPLVLLQLISGTGLQEGGRLVFCLKKYSNKWKNILVKKNTLNTMYTQKVIH